MYPSAILRGALAVCGRVEDVLGRNHYSANSAILSCCFARRKVFSSVSAFQWDSIDNKAVDTVRVLAADAVEKVGNGHPGTAMSLAPAAYLLFQKVMRRDPSDSEWIGRDRFILSVGHSSLTQYIQLYMGGYGLELDDLKALRTWGSKTPGHPEYHHTDGVEITTGPLGQGLASAVGFAYAARYERGLFDPQAPAGTSPFDHFVYVIAGDGDLQEGVTSEASSLAGHQELGNLIAIYDSNQISIEDDTNIAFTEDVAARYESYGWQVLTVDWKKTGEYVEDVAELNAAIEEAKGETSKPTIIILKTIIGWPSPKKQNSGKIHGSALGAEELAGLKEVLGFDPEQNFQVDPEVISHTRKAVERGQQQHAEWNESLAAWAEANPDKKVTPRLPRWQGGLDPRRVRQGHQRPRWCDPGAVGRFRRPRRVEPHHHRRRRLVRAREVVDPRVEVQPERPRPPLRYP
jgi:transketolase